MTAARGFDGNCHQALRAVLVRGFDHGLFFFFLQLVHVPDDQKQDKSDDEEVDDRMDKHAPAKQVRWP